MSNSNYNNFMYPPPSINATYAEQQMQQWNWGSHQLLQNFNCSVPPPPPLPPPTYNTPPPHHPPPLHLSPATVLGSLPGPRHYYDKHAPGARHYSPRGRYNSQPYFNGLQQNWPRTNYKRPRLDSGESTEPRSKGVKKKKKPLSQNVPRNKGWTMDEAETALRLEKEYNKRVKNHSLILKFPDLEVNKDIVFKYHGAIENVHFQQPSTARYCFVTLKESADADGVISALNKVKFGNGHITAEYKKDREDDQTITPSDIDPLTLYVGNLAQEITKDDMVKAFPKCRRIDIGYAKKMKYTRYAFVTFKNASDSVEAFTKTHSTEMYSKSLIVRFRRLQGTVGMPGESKPQNPPKNLNDDRGTPLEPETDPALYPNEDGQENGRDVNKINLPPPPPVIGPSRRSPPPPPVIGPSIQSPLIIENNIINLTSIKKEPTSDDEEDEEEEEEDDFKPIFDYTSKLMKPNTQPSIRHRPQIKTEVKAEVKTEVKTEDDDKPIYVENTSKDVFFGWGNEPIRRPKEEEDESDYHGNCQEYTMYNGSEEEDEADDILERPADFDRLYEDMVNHANVIKSLKTNRPS